MKYINIIDCNGMSHIIKTNIPKHLLITIMNNYMYDVTKIVNAANFIKLLKTYNKYKIEELKISYEILL